MKREFILTGKSLAALAAIFLGVVIALVTTIAQGSAALPLDAAAATRDMAKEKDHITPLELARWIVEKRQDYQLIDIRQPWQFDDYHIPTAISIPFPQLFQTDNLKKLSRQKKVVLYGLGAGHAAQGQLLLSLKGYKAYSLREGLSAWWDDVMTPTSLRPATEDSPAGYQEARKLRGYFSGQAPAAEAAAPAQVAPPPLPATQQPSPEKKEKQQLRLGRGCS
jgi:rhodanese-related sulfurtransferase